MWIARTSWISQDLSGIAIFRRCPANQLSHFDAASRPPIGLHPLAPIETAVFLRSPIALVSPGLKIGFGALREEDAPRGFECGSSLMKTRRGAPGTFTRL
jgi:hypothetical protein